MDKFLDLDNPEWNEIAGRKLDDGAYRMAFQRWERYWADDAPEGRLCIKGRVKGRLALGLGAKGVQEVGLRLSQTYGTPLIPGSGIKGVLRAAADDRTDFKKEAVPAAVRFLFGEPDGMGFASFQDAWWIPEVRSPLAMDVVTTHHPKYYLGTPPRPPSDCDNPTPVRFLSVRGSFLFVADTPNREWRDYLRALLKQT